MRITRDMLRMECVAIPGVYLFKDFNKEWETYDFEGKEIINEGGE